MLNLLNSDTDRIYSVYEHVNKINGKRYIGITKQLPIHRWGYGGKNYFASPRFWSAIQRYGWKNFDHNVLYSNLTKEEACKLEIELIAKYQSQINGYNITAGGDHPNITDETKEKMSKSMMGNKNGLGKPCSKEKAMKISLAQKGKSLSEEHKLKLSLAKKGKPRFPCPEETKRKISNSHKKSKVIDLNTGIIYESIQQCARLLNILATNVCACCKHKHDHVNGHKIRYLNEVIKA